jgi:hypothetical protein
MGALPLFTCAEPAFSANDKRAGNGVYKECSLLEINSKATFPAGWKG